MKKLLSIFLAVVTIVSACSVGAVQFSAAIITHKAPTDSWDKSAADFIREIKMGINYGNGLEDNNSAGYYPTSIYTNSTPSNWYNCEFDGYPTDCLGNTVYDPKEWETNMSYSAQWPLTKAMLTEIHDAGFDALRLPCTWFNWSDYDSGPFTLGNGVTCTGDKISEVYLQRVKEIVDWCCELNMYCIINMHHDDSIWLHVDTTNESDWNYTKTRYQNFWKQIAYYFKDYGSNVMFAGMNEIVYGQYFSEWYASRMATTQQNCNNHMGELYQIFVDAVRESGGNNTKRYLWIAPMGANISMSSIQFPKDTKSYNGVNRICVEIHEYNSFQDCQTATAWNGTFAGYESMKANGYGYVIGEGNFTDSCVGATDDSNYTRSQVYRELYKCSATYGVPIFLWDNGGIGGTKSSKYRVTNGSVYVHPASVWSVYNRRDGGFRWPAALKAMQESVYGHDAAKTSVTSPANYYYWNSEYKATSLNAGLLMGKTWKKGVYQADGTLDTSAIGLYVDKISVTPGEKYELRTNDWWGTANYFGYTVYGVTSDGSFVNLDAGVRTKGIYYQLCGKQHASEGETVSLNGVVGKDVAFVVPGNVTQLAISLVGKNLPNITQDMVNNQIDSTAIVPSLSKYTGQIVTQSTAPTQSQTTQSQTTQSQTATTTKSGTKEKIVKAKLVGSFNTATANNMRVSLPSTVPSDATAITVRVKQDSNNYRLSLWARDNTDASASGATTAKLGDGGSGGSAVGANGNWETLSLDISGYSNEFKSIIIFPYATTAPSNYYYIDDIAYVDASGVPHTLVDFDSCTSGTYGGGTSSSNRTGLGAMGALTNYDFFGDIIIEDGSSGSSTTATTQTTGTSATTTKPTTQTTTKNEDGILGDLTRDGAVNIVDLLIMKRVAGDPDSDYAKSYQTIADLNKDGTVNISDLLIMKRLVAKI